MKFISTLLILSLIHVSSPFSFAEPRRPEERRREGVERREEQKRTEERKKGSESDGHCVGICEGISSGEGAPGTRKRPTEDKSSLEKVVEASKKATIGAKEKDEVQKALEAQFKNLESSPEAKEGLTIREEEFVKSRERNSENEEEWNKLGGSEGVFLSRLLKRIKEGWKDQIESLKKLVCPQDCGHKGMKKSCRIMDQLLNKIPTIAGVAATATLASISVQQAQASLSNPGKESKLNVTLTFNEGGKEKPVKLELEDKPVAAEEVSAARVSK